MNDETFNASCSLDEMSTKQQSNQVPPIPSSSSATEKRVIKKKPTADGRTAVARTTTTTNKHESFVFVRVRPFLSSIINNNNESETKQEDELPLKDLVMETTIGNDNDGNKNDVSAMNGSLPISGFNGVFGPNTTNEMIYVESFLPRIHTIMKGGTASYFCYGYTGAGKTHTTLGYNNEDEGVFQLAANEIFNRVSLLNQQQQENDAKKEPYIVIVSVVEVYNDDVFDLLAGEEKPKCTLRKNKKGQLLVRGATHKETLNNESDDNAEKIRDELGYDIDYKIITKSLSTIPIESTNDLMAIRADVSKYRNVGISTTHDQSSRSHAIFRLDIVTQSLLDVMSKLESMEQIKPSLQTAYDKKRTYKLRHQVLDVERKIDEYSQSIEDMYLAEDKKGSPLGGRLILVDLAGADSDHRSIGEGGQTIAQRKESAAINKSLMALKECIRGLSLSKKAPFRNSSLTRLLEEVLTPRVNRDSDSVMIVNVGPEGNLKSKTINSLRYGSMFSTAESRNKKKPSSSIRNRSKNGVRTRETLMEAKMRMKREMEQQLQNE